MFTNILRAPASPVNPLAFAALPVEAIRDSRITPTDLRLLSVLISYCHSKPHCWPCVKTLARDINRCERTVQLCLRRLMAAGWVSTKPDTNPTGRLILMTWRCAPRRNENVCSPAQRAADESDEREGNRAFVPPTKEEERELLTPLLSRPVNDPFRRFAQLRI